MSPNPIQSSGGIHAPTHRRGTVRLRLTSADGQPLANREIDITQTKHRFLFGASCFELPLFNNELTGEAKELAEMRVAKMDALFNAYTLPFYWGTFEPTQGKPETQRMLRAAQTMTQRGKVLKGHPLCWHTVTAPWLLNLSNEEILRQQLARIRRDVTPFAGLIDMWDVINEVVIMPIFDKYDNGITRICKSMGRINLVRAVFEETRAANPAATLLLNDFDMSPAYDILVEGCLEAGIKIDVIGLQSHMHQGYWGVEKTLSILERFARFNLPLHFTETNLVSGHIMPEEIVDLNDYKVDNWPSTPEGEERQAGEIITHYRTLFNHPLVEGLTYWSFSDGGWLNAPAGLVRKDASSKPSYEELFRLLKGEWWSGSTNMVTDTAGEITFEGILGEYEAVYAGKSYTFNLTRDSDHVVELVVYG